MSKEEPTVTVVPLQPLVHDEYPEKVHVSDHPKKNLWSSSITALLCKPPPGLHWMSQGVWKCIICLLTWVVYVLLGAAITMKLAEEYVQEDIPHPDWKMFKEHATDKDMSKIERSLELKENIIKMCNHTFLNLTFPFEVSGEEFNETLSNGWSVHDALDDVERTCKESLFSVGWVTDYDMVPSYIDAVYYIMTALTTIGYGHFYPTNTRGQMFCVFYCLFGIPLTFILLNNFSGILVIKMLHTYKKYLATDPYKKDSLLYIVAACLVVTGFIVFMFIPAIAFAHIEYWEYSRSFYYTFVTISTMGFGDLVAGWGESYFAYNDGTSITVYKLIIIIWVMTALGYWLLVIKFIMKASKITTEGEFGKTLSSHMITEQATSFSDLVWKVRNEKEDKTFTNGMNVSRNVEQPIFARDTECVYEASEQPLSLKNLFGIKVVIRNDDAAVMKNIVSQGAKEEGGLPMGDTIPDEITLPLRDALNLVFSYQQ